MMCLESQVKRYKKTVDALNLNKTIVQCVTAHDHAKIPGCPSTSEPCHPA